MLTLRSSSAADMMSVHSSSRSATGRGASPQRLSPPSPPSPAAREFTHGSVILPPSLAALTLGGAAAARKPSSLGMHAARTVAWVMAAACVAVGVGAVKGYARGMEFVTAYLVEYSLSVDNLFVFMLMFKYFRVPRDAQQKVLRWGIFGAMALRGVMIVAGKMLTQRFEWVAGLFAVFLVYSAGKLLLEEDDAEEDLDDNRVIRFAKRVLPVGDRYVGDRFFAVSETGKVMGTPLLVVLVAIEVSDVVFAVDSVPAVLGISDDLFVIYVSNVLAVMGLRSLFFVVACSMGSVRFLRQALALVLAFIGGKMMAACVGVEVGTGVSLGVVVLTVGGGMLLSAVYPKRVEAMDCV